MKPCSVCGGPRDNGTSQCRACRAKAMRAYRATDEGKLATRRMEANRKFNEERARKAKEYAVAYMKTATGKEVAKRAQARYRAKHKDKLLAKERQRRIDDPTFRLRANLRRMVRFALSRRGYEKHTKTYSILGCDFDTLRVHLERNFMPGMSWSNYGEWEIDHYTPISLGQTEEEILRLSHYTNLRPLWKKMNRDKGAGVPEDAFSLQLSSILASGRHINANNLLKEYSDVQ